MTDRYRLAYYVLAVLLLLESVAAGAVAWHLRGLAPTEIFIIGDISRGLAGWLVIPLLWLTAISIQMAKRSTDSPTKTIVRMVRKNKGWLIRGIFLSVLLIPMARAFAAIKSSIPHIVPFYADPFLIEFDKLLLGQDAWTFTRLAIGDFGTVLIDRLYALWFTCVALLAGWFNFSRDANFQIRSAISFNLCWFILGSTLAIPLSSVGPCFYDHFFGGDYFAVMKMDLDRVHSEEFLLSVRAMNYLLENKDTLQIGVGISAMPSLHVSISFLAFLATLTLKDRIWIKAVSGFYAAAILLGSVHLGWHYLSDGIVSIFGTWLIWVGCGRFVNWVERRADARARIAPGQGAHAPA